MINKIPDGKAVRNTWYQYQQHSWGLCTCKNPDNDIRTFISFLKTEYFLLLRKSQKLCHIHSATNHQLVPGKIIK